jgi:hypothetical protein
VVDEEPWGDETSTRTERNPRQVRARRRRRRRRFGVVVFLAVAVGVFVAAYVGLAGNDNSSDTTTGQSVIAAAATTTTAVKSFGPYKVTTGVHVRQGAGTSFPAVGTIEVGHEVFVACYVDGEVVASPNGPIPQWLKLTGFGPHGWVTALYVSTGDDLTNNRIPPCPDG